MQILLQTDKRLSRQSLSQREQEVLNQVASGLPAKQIAFNLGITEQTVKNHKKNMFRKIGAKSSAQLIALSINIL